MNSTSIRFIVAALVLGTVACVKSHKMAQDEAPASRFAGYWLAEDEAQELRKTGKLQSQCEAIKKDGTVLNLRRIDNQGNEFVVSLIEGADGNSKLEDIQKVSTISTTGQMKLEPDFAEDSDAKATFIARVDGDVLTETASLNKNSAGLKYLRSSEEEIRKYIEAQKECLN